MIKQGMNPFGFAAMHDANAQTQASRYGVDCAWKIIDVPDVGHDGERMSAAAAPVLGPQLRLPG